MTKYYNIDDFEQAWQFSHNDKTEAFNGKTCDPGVRHDPSEIMQRNAAFLLESSQKIDGYNETTLLQMQRSFDEDDYSKVIELAYQHDRVRRHKRHLFSPIITPLTRVRQFVANILSFLN